MEWGRILPGLNLFQIFALERVHLIHSVEDGRERDGSTVHVGGRRVEQCTRWKWAQQQLRRGTWVLFGAVISDSQFLSGTIFS